METPPQSLPPGPLPPGRLPAAQGPAVALVSGGLDSATVLAMASAAGWTVHAVAVDYGQRHRTELAAAERIAAAHGAASFRIVRVDLGQVGGSSLTDASMAVPPATAHGTPAAVPDRRSAAGMSGATDIPDTYVPARNLLFLSLAAGLVETLGGVDLLAGMNAVDYSGYPDCRRPFVDAFEAAATLGTAAGTVGRSIRVHTPLIELSKREIVAAGVALGVDYADTISCYAADDEGLACAACDACRLRAEGFAGAGIADPTRYAPGAGRP
ncbi:MAG: 7-cyano-7-deazaguanine synthase QueC [Phycisphaerales bacterium]